MAGKWIPNEQTLSPCTENVTVKSSTDVLTDVTFFALFGFVAQADFKSVDFTGQVTERAEKYILKVCNPVNSKIRIKILIQT